MRTIALVSDAYGGRGGIALYNRNFLKALCAYPGMNQVVALPRNITYHLQKMPPNLDYCTESAGSKLRYLKQCLKLTFFCARADLIICGHLHLLPFAWLLKLRHRCIVLPITYGVEAWTPTTHGVVNYLCGKLSGFISIRKLTASRLKFWAQIPNANFYYLPNCIDEEQFGVGVRRKDLVEKFKLHGKKVVMTTGRMDSIEYDRRKGFDEVLEVLPELRQQVPEIIYLIVGDGDDKERLESKAKELKVHDIVRFTGYVSDHEKADFYRLADVFAMPGSNPIFDRYPFRFVFIEALACGVPVVGCQLEDESERDDGDAKALIIQVDPNDKLDIARGIVDALAWGGSGVNPALKNYYFPTFRDRLHGYLRQISSMDVA